METRQTTRWRFTGRSACVFAAAVALLAAPVDVRSEPAGIPREVTFTKDIAPILQRSCQNCHRPDGVAPMSLVSYEDARPWARAIKTRTALRDKRGAMPPWFVEKNIGIQKFKGDVSLSDEEIAKVAKWADTGAPRGNPADMPPPLDFSGADKWHIGEPDLIISTPTVTVAPAGADRWEPVGVQPTGLSEDRYVAAFEVIEVNDVPKAATTSTVGGRLVFHHLNFSSFVPDNENGTTTNWHTYEVGKNADFFDPGAGRLLAAGSVLHFDLAHLHSNGREVKSRLDIGFKFHPKGYKPTVKMGGVGGLANGVDIDLKAMESNIRLDAYTVLQQNAKLLAFEPHMHATGVRMCLEAIWGSSIQTLSCVGYDHSWVRTYTYADDAAPLLPKGTILHAVAYMDNSPANRNVVDPRNWGGSGRRSVANMFIAITQSAVLTDEEFEQEMAARREKLRLTKNDYVIGCPLCQAVFTTPAETTAASR